MQFMDDFGEHRTPTSSTRKFSDDEVLVDANGGSLAERRASKRGRNGFNVSKNNTATPRCPLGSPMVRSPCLTIPPGINPTVLLDSPIMLLNTHDLPSPTTGTFPIHPIKDEHSLLNPVMPEDGSRHGSEDSYFRFTAHGELSTLENSLRLKNQEADIDRQAFESEKTLMDFEFLAEFPKEASALKYEIISSTDNNLFDGKIVNGNCDTMESCLSAITNNQSSITEESTIGEDQDIEMQPPLDGEQKGSYIPMGMLRTSEDGYNWRKYGQKQVKGSEYPRSYYKCTHPNCLVKKKVERALDGHITEIVYKGGHDHAQPDPNRRGMLGSVPTPDDAPEIGEGGGNRAKVEAGLTWRNTQDGVKDIKLISDWSVDGLERTSSVSVMTELSDPLLNPQGKTVGAFESVDTTELSSTLASHDDDGSGGGNDDDDLTTQGSISACIEADDAEPELKRRRKEGSSIETNLASRSVREPRVVVQIETEVDILEDGYRWRKYGQKVVKGNPNPRSYYKCTSAGCLVRKHVERASHDLKCVITTYEGKHNHLVPAARNSSQVNSSNGNAQSSASHVPSTMGLSRNSNVPKCETQIPDLATQFYPKPEFNHDLRSGCFDTFSNNMKLGAPSFCQVKFPPLQNTLPYSSFGLNSKHTATSISGSLASAVSDFPISLPLSQKLSAASLNFTDGRPMPPFQVFLAGQQLRETDRFLTPKQEHNDDNICAFQPIADSSSGSSSSVSSVYQQIMGNFP